MALRNSNRRGMTLLEVLVALTILISVGGGLVALAHAELTRTAAASRREALYSQADQAMTRIALLPRRDLERRLGSHPHGRFVISVQRPSLELFRLAIADSTAPSQPLLVTVVYRPRELR